MSGVTGFAIMDRDICDFPPMQVATTIEYSRILNQGMYLKQMDGHMSFI